MQRRGICKRERGEPQTPLLPSVGTREGIRDAIRGRRGARQGKTMRTRLAGAAQSCLEGDGRGGA